VVTVRRKDDQDAHEKDEKRDAASKTFWQLLVILFLSSSFPFLISVSDVGRGA
jgi:hypothetical protein